MAQMVPLSGPREYVSSSKEGEIYKALSSLPDEFVVVHSLKLVSAEAGLIKENEADFVIFHKDLGVLCVESKAGAITYKDGDWYYGNGIPMPHGGPFNQAANEKYRIKDTFHEKGLGGLVARCRMHHAVWFPSIERASLKGIDLPSEADAELILCADDLNNPEERIRAIMKIGVAGVDTQLTEEEAEAILTKILCPSFGLVPSPRLKYDLANIEFLRLLESQKRVLDFLVDQKTAVINGVAGSGKTLIAIERAKQLSECNETVLLLCYNALLGNDLKKRCEQYEGVDTYTIAGFACKLCNTQTPDYEGLYLALLRLMETGAFPYKHVIVDEGQDFGIDSIEQSDILEALSEIVAQKGGTFYLFYDQNQLVQGSGVPGFIERADCKLTLYVNCRNTKNIALSSVNALGLNEQIATKEAATSGSVPKMLISDDTESQAAFVDAEIQSLRDGGIDDIVILTCKTEEKSSLSDYFENGLWGATKVPIFSCRRFKGLEADAVILIDVDQDIWIENDAAYGQYQAGAGILYYTGASRARFELRIVCNLGDDDCINILDKLGIQSRRRPRVSLAKCLNAKLMR